MCSIGWQWLYFNSSTVTVRPCWIFCSFMCSMKKKTLIAKWWLTPRSMYASHLHSNKTIAQSKLTSSERMRFPPSNPFPFPYYHHHLWVHISYSCWGCDSNTLIGQHASRLFPCLWFFVSYWIKSELLPCNYDTQQHNPSLRGNYSLSAIWHSRPLYTTHMCVCVYAFQLPSFGSVYFI